MKNIDEQHRQLENGVVESDLNQPTGSRAVVHNPRHLNSKAKSDRRRHRVEIALRVIRKANANQATIDRERAFAVPSANSDFRGAQWRKIPYSESVGIPMKQLENIMEQAKLNRALTIEGSKSESKLKNLGKPRGIFPKLVAQIKEEESERLLETARKEKEDKKIREQNAKRYREMKQEQEKLLEKQNPSRQPKDRSLSLLIPGDSGGDDDENSSSCNDSDGDELKINTSFELQQRMRPFSAFASPSPNVGRSRQTIIMPRSGTAARINNNNNNNYYHNNDDNNRGLYSPDALERLSTWQCESASSRRAGRRTVSTPSPSPSRNFQYSVLQSDEKLKSVLEQRELLMQQKQEAIFLRATHREREMKANQYSEGLRARQRMLLPLVFQLSKLSVLKSYIENYRDDREKRREEYAIRKAVKCIERWWFFTRLNLLIARNATLMKTLQVGIRNMWRSFNVKKRRKGIKLIKVFINDSSGISDYMRKIYAFRGRIMIIQRYFRSWIRIMEARFELLWLSYERIHKHKYDAFKLHSRSAEIEALKNAAQLPGYSEIMNGLNSSKNQVLGLLHKGDETMKRYFKAAQITEKRLQLIRDPLQQVQAQKNSLRKSTSFRVGPHSSDQSISTSSHPLNNTSVSVSVSSSTSMKNYGRRKTKARTAKKSFYRKMLESPDTREKAMLLRDILGQERKRHIFFIKLEEQKQQTQVKLMRVNVKGLRQFLRDPVSMEGIEQTIVMVGMRDGSKKKSESQRHPPFLLLTQGGNAKIDHSIQFK